MGIPSYHRVAERHAEEISALARDLVRIDTTNTGVMPTGSETEAALLLERLLRSAGIPTEIDGLVRERGNLFASVEGTSGRPGLLLISHLDVVPAGDLRQWTHPPFEGVIDHGHLFGRGAADMKGIAAAQVIAILLRRLKVPLACSVGLVCVADEEAGGAYGWAGSRGRTRTGSARSAVSTKAAVFTGGRTATTGAFWAWGEGPVRGDGDVSRPRGARRPAVAGRERVALAAAAGRLRDYESERDGHAHFRLSRPSRRPGDPGSVDAVIAHLGPTSPRLADHVRQVSRLLVTPTLVSAGVKSSSVPDACRLACDVRALPHQGPVEVESVVRRLMPDADLAITQTAVANTSPVSEQFLSTLGDTLHRVADASVDVVPTVTGGFTDSRFVRELGVPAYGFTPGHPDSDPSRHQAHGPNESIAVRDLVVQAAVYMDLAARCGGNG